MSTEALGMGTEGSMGTEALGMGTEGSMGTEALRIGTEGLLLVGVTPPCPPPRRHRTYPPPSRNLRNR